MRLLLAVFTLLIAFSVKADIKERVSTTFNESITRYSVPHGWLVTYSTNGVAASIVFYPDENHEWQLNK